MKVPAGIDDGQAIPLRGKGNAGANGGPAGDIYISIIVRPHAIFERDMWMVSSSDIILCDLSGSKAVSIGCCMEMAWAAKLGKHSILVMDDGNIHDHRFMREAADIVKEIRG